MWRSITTTCGCRSITACTAWAPSAASPTTLMSGVREKKRRSTALTEGESSTSSTRIKPGASSLPAASSSAAPAQPADEVHQLPRVQALLGEIGVGADLQAAQAVLRAVAGGDDDDGELREVLHAAELGRQLEAVHARHLDVGDDAVEALLAQQRQGLLGIPRRHHLEAGVLQQAPL